VRPFLDARRQALLDAELAFQGLHRFPDLPRGPVHGDLFRDNALFESGRMSAVFDFYFAGVDVLLFDVAVCANLFGDIITDLGAMIQGGMGLAASGNIHPGKVSLFEPIHGSAPKYAGKNVACPVAIREGIVESRIATSGREEASGSVRHKSVMRLAQKTDCDMRHAAHVARLAARIFDQTQKLHRLADDQRELLEYAAMLHESGAHISDRGHHKHSYYLIRHADLRGFTDEQLQVIANVARYYRKSVPGLDDANFSELSEEQQETVSKLSAILRVAEGLDRGHRQRVRDVAVQNGSKTLRFIARTRADASVEIESAEKRAKYFARLFETRVKFEVL